MSVTLAPRARMAVNASWPGVSRNVTLRPSDVDLVGADVLGDAAGLGRRRRDDSRIASSRVVLPWSTWPMMVTTGGRATRASAGSSKTPRLPPHRRRAGCDLAARARAPISSTASSLSDTVTVDHSPGHHNSDDLAGEMPRRSARSLTVMPDGTFTGPVGVSTSCAWAPARPPRSLARAAACGRPAASITTGAWAAGAAAPRWDARTPGGWPGCCERHRRLRRRDALLASSSSTTAGLRLARRRLRPAAGSERPLLERARCCGLRVRGRFADQTADLFQGGP